MNPHRAPSQNFNFLTGDEFDRLWRGVRAPDPASPRLESPESGRTPHPQLLVLYPVTPHLGHEGSPTQTALFQNADRYSCGQLPVRSVFHTDSPGCFTCRKRRIKVRDMCLPLPADFWQCDERLPICLRCSKGGRECIYPLHLETTTFVRLPGSGKLASAHSHDSRFQVQDDYDIGHFPCPSPSEVVTRLKESESQSDDTKRSLVPAPSVHRSPGSTKCQAIQFFIKFHQTSVVPAHYFRFYDYHRLHLGYIPSMAESSACLSYALSAFSALIYSAQVNPKARQVAFSLYSMAVRELMVELQQIETQDNLNEVIATALVLAAMDVWHLKFVSDQIAIFRRYKKVFQACAWCRPPFAEVFQSGNTVFNYPWTVSA
jgi:hypothetical protein